MLKNLTLVWPHRSMERVAMHGTWRLSHDLPPSQPYRELRSDPNRSYNEALADLALIGVELDTLEEVAQLTPRHPSPERDIYLMQIERDCAARSSMVEKIKLIEIIGQGREERAINMARFDALTNRVAIEILGGQLTIF